MNSISLNIDGLNNYISEYEYENMANNIYTAHDMIENKSGEGSNMLGWIDLPSNRNEEEIQKIKNCAKEIRKKADVFVIIGIGGSYLGARAVIEMLKSPLYNMESQSKRNGPQIIYAGNNMSPKYMRALIEYLEDKEVAINVISKSGKTLEPAVTFRILKLFMEEKYGKGGASNRIHVTTDRENGILKEIAELEKYETFVIPDDVGGRYSVLSPVGLLPIAVAGIDIEELLDGAMLASHLYDIKSIEENDCYKYAAIRNILYNKGKDIEIMTSYEPSMQYFLEWYKQLFGESEGKDHKGIFPSGMIFTTDLHSMGQLVQDGKRNIFETVINIERDRSFIKVPKVEISEDGLDYLENMDIDYINKKAMDGTIKAHVDGGVPVSVINIEDMTPYNVGHLIYFFEKACAISGYILGVNPFNQPGVEAYKQNMMNLLENK